jgi:hypothetical protein
VSTVEQALPVPGTRRWNWVATGWSRYRYLLGVYAASRVLYMLVAVVDALLQHKDLSIELSNWDGQWYVQTTEHWYFHHVFTLPGQYSTLGFLPLFPLLMWLVAHVTQLSVIASGVTLSIICGAVATVLVIELAKEWWGEAAARRALLFWCFFPGTIVFSMVYTEGLTFALQQQ